MRWSLAALLGVCLALSPTPSRGEPPEPDHWKRGRAEFDAGRESLKQGDLQGALAHFRTSLSLHASPGTLLNLASVEETLGLFATSHAHYEEALTLLPESDERVRIARERMKSIAPRIPTFEIRFEPSAPPGVIVRLDDKDLPTSSTAPALRADPGAHTLTIAAPGHSERRIALTLQAGAHQTIIVPPLSTTPEPTATVTPTPTPTAAPTAAPTLTAAPNPSAAPTSARPIAPPSSGTPPFRTAAFSLLGVGGAAAIAGAITGALSLARKQDLDAACPPATPRTCAPSLQPLHAEGEALAHTSTATFILAGVTLAAGVTLLVIPSGKPTTPSTKVAVTPTGLLVQGRF